LSVVDLVPTTEAEHLKSFQISSAEQIKLCY